MTMKVRLTPKNGLPAIHNDIIEVKTGDNGELILTHDNKSSWLVIRTVYKNGYKIDSIEVLR